MESYKEFLNRINSFEHSVMDLGEGEFWLNKDSVHKKVDESNKFKPFFGDTVVFDLDESTKELLNLYLDRLYAEVPDCFSQRLVKNTMHMTLHDLSNSPILSDVSSNAFNNEIRLINKLNKESFNFDTINMKSKAIFNMIGTSLVMGLYPTDEQEYEKLMTLYSFVDDIKKLDYPLTPHITLGYYNHYGFSQEDKKRLENIVNELNESTLGIELKLNKLFYQKFTDMNSYVNIFSFK